VRGTSRADKSYGDVFINEITECAEFELGKGVDGSERWFLTFLEVNLEIIRTMLSKLFSFTFAKHIRIVVVIRGNVFKIYRRSWQRSGGVCSFGGSFRSRQM